MNISGTVQVPVPRHQASPLDAASPLSSLQTATRTGTGRRQR